MDLVPFRPDDVIDAASLRERGLTSHDVGALCRSGRLHRLSRGWFATREPTGEVDRHLLTLRALVRHFDGRAAASHHSRLLLSGIPVWRADLSVVHLTRTSDRGSRSRSGYRLHPRVAGLAVADAGPGPGVGLAVAVVQTGILNGPMDALIAADAALHLGLLDRLALQDAVRLFEGRTGRDPPPCRRRRRPQAPPPEGGIPGARQHTLRRRARRARCGPGGEVCPSAVDHARSGSAGRGPGAAGFDRHWGSGRRVGRLVNRRRG